MNYRVAMRLGTIITVALLAFMLASPSQADEAPFRGITSSWHEPHRGLSWVTDGSPLQGGTVHKLPPEPQSIAACPAGDLFCRAAVRSRYAQARADWRWFNTSLWSIAIGLPTCDPQKAATEDCARESSLHGETLVILSGAVYYAQDSLRP